MTVEWKGAWSWRGNTRQQAVLGRSTQGLHGGIRSQVRGRKPTVTWAPPRFDLEVAAMDAERLLKGEGRW